MIIQEPIKAAISFALENFAYPDAIFLSERLHAEVATDENLFLLANSYYRSGKPNVAHVLLTEKHAKICKSPQCLFLLAKCCYDLKKFTEAINTLTGPFFHHQFTLENDTHKLISRDELIQFYGELSSFVAQLLGSLFIKLDNNQPASHYFRISLKINPFLWSSYEKLVQLDPAAVESNKLLSLDNFEFKYSCGTNPVSSSLNNSNSTGPLRRSSRLYSNSNWVKENTTATKTSKITRTPTKRSRRTINFEKNSDQKVMNDIGKSNENLKVVTSIDLAKAGIKVQRSSASGLLELMAKFGSAYKLLSEFKCKEAIEEFQRLPANHLTTGFVLSSIGRAYFEMSKYDDSINYFKKCRQLEPYRLQGMEIYSTALWHQQKEVELSCLAQTLIDFDKHAPETWCVAGNCFSLQKEHEISIKFLKRAIQVDTDFCYAYTLLGHELVSADELDNAMACFRNAARIDPRHYNAWYGIGMIYYKQEKYLHAYNNYKRALDISPYNPILMCHLAIVCHHMKKSPQEKRALELLDKASQLDPSNALVKFHRASINFATENYNVAMEELEQLKQIVPKESMVYFLIGKIHKIRNETHLALMNFSWAMDLDPKGASNQIKELIDRHYGNDEEIMIHSNSNGANSNNYNIQDASTSSASTPNTTPFQQRSTLTPSGAAGSAGPSGSATSLVNTSGSAGASTSNANNGSNNSNNISNNNGSSISARNRFINPVRRYIIREYEGGVIPEDDDEDDEDDQPDDDETFEEANELVDSTNLLDVDSVSFGVDNRSDNVDANFHDDDSLML